MNGKLLPTEGADRLSTAGTRVLIRVISGRCSA